MDGVNQTEREALRPRPKVRVAPALVLCAVILLAGVVIGVGLSALFPSIPGLIAPRWTPPKTISELTDRYMNRIDDQVDLSKEQKEQVRPIVELHLRDITKIREQMLPEMERQMEHLDSQIRPLLHQDQLQDWAEYLQRRGRWYRLADTQPATQTAPSE